MNGNGGGGFGGQGEPPNGGVDAGFGGLLMHREKIYKFVVCIYIYILSAFGIIAPK